MEQSEIWDDLVGAAWVRHADTIDAQGKRFGIAAMDMLEPIGGASVLDVGCGTGETTLRLADRAGSDGRVVGVDLSEQMINHARSRAAGVANVEFVFGDATTLDRTGEFDVVYSRNGVMFFEDPTAAFARLLTYADRNGRLAFCCWKDPFANPWMSVPALTSASVIGPPDLPGPGQPGPFAFASEEIITSTLDAAGWTNVVCSELSVEQAYAAGDARSTASAMVEIMPPLARALRTTPEKRGALIDAIAVALEPYEQDGEVVMQATGWIVGATAH